MRQQDQNLNNQDKVKSESENLNKTEKQLLSQNSKQTNNESVGFEDLIFSPEKEEEFYQLENNLIKIVISNKGERLQKLILKI